MYHNLYGNKQVDFNDATSPFSNLNKLFMCGGRSDVGDMILDKLNSLGGGIQTKYRLCIISKINGGERVLTEVQYDTSTGKLLENQ